MVKISTHTHICFTKTCVAKNRRFPDLYSSSTSNTAGRLHCTSQLHEDSVLDELTTLLILDGFESNPTACNVGLRDAHSQEKILKGDRNPTGSPVEANGLTDHVLIFTGQHNLLEEG